MATLVPGKLLYLRTPHTASVATEKAILAQIDGAVKVAPGHGTLAQIKGGDAFIARVGLKEKVDPSGLITGEEIVVTTVRNPYDAIVTWWLRAARGEGSFTEFIRAYDRKPHLEDGKTIFIHLKDADFVMRYETLEANLAALMDALALPRLEVSVDNTTHGKRPWQEYYGDGSLGAVNERFEDQIREAGYPVYWTMSEVPVDDRVGSA